MRIRIRFRIQLINFDADPDFYWRGYGSGCRSRLPKWCRSLRILYSSQKKTDTCVVITITSRTKFCGNFFLFCRRSSVSRQGANQLAKSALFLYLILITPCPILHILSTTELKCHRLSPEEFLSSVLTGTNLSTMVWNTAWKHLLLETVQSTWRVR